MHCQALLRHCLRVGAVTQRGPDKQSDRVIRPVIGFLQRFALRGESQGYWERELRKRELTLQKEIKAAVVAFRPLAQRGKEE